MKRRKLKAERKVLVIPVRVSEEQKKTLAEKAKRRGLGVSTWLLQLGMTAPDQPPGSER